MTDGGWYSSLVLLHVRIQFFWAPYTGRAALSDPYAFSPALKLDWLLMCRLIPRLSSLFCWLFCLRVASAQSWLLFWLCSLFWNRVVQCLCRFCSRWLWLFSNFQCRANLRDFFQLCKECQRYFNGFAVGLQRTLGGMKKLILIHPLHEHAVPCSCLCAHQDFIVSSYRPLTSLMRLSPKHLFK